MERRDDSPSAEVPNYAGRMLWAIWSLTIGATVFLALRVYCKLTRHRSLWWDDYILIASWITVLTSTALLTEGVKYGIGMHFHDMDPLKKNTVAILSYAAGFATILGAAWSKTSFAITLLRIVTNGWEKWLLWFILISANVILGVSGLIMWIQCWPIEKLWIYETESCWPKHVLERYQTFTSVYSGILDIVLALLPWKIMWKVTINKKEKLGALVAMSMGVFSGIIAFLKIISLDDISDSSSTTIDIKVFGTAEPAVAIMAASIPILRAFIRKNVPSQQGSVSFVQLSNLSAPNRSYRSTAKRGSDEILVTPSLTRHESRAAVDSQHV